MNKILLWKIVFLSWLLASCSSESPEACPDSAQKLNTHDFKISVLNRAKEIENSLIGEPLTIQLAKFPGELYPVGSPDLLLTLNGKIGEKVSIDFEKLENIVTASVVSEKGIKVSPTNTKILRVGTFALPKDNKMDKYGYGYGFYDDLQKKLFIVIYVDRKAELQGSVDRGNTSRKISVSVKEPGFYAVTSDHGNQVDCAFSPSNDLYFVLIKIR